MRDPSNARSTQRQCRVSSSFTRFACDNYDYFAFRYLRQSLGISLRSAAEPIDDTSTGKLMEGVLAAFAQFDNDCRSDRTRAGAKSPSAWLAELERSWQTGRPAYAAAIFAASRYGGQVWLRSILALQTAAWFESSLASQPLTVVVSAIYSLVWGHHLVLDDHVAVDHGVRRTRRIQHYRESCCQRSRRSNLSPRELRHRRCSESCSDRGYAIFLFHSSRAASATAPYQAAAARSISKSPARGRTSTTCPT